MKRFLLLIISILVLNCASKQESALLDNNSKSIQECKENGICVLHVLYNQSINVKKEHTGVYYPEFVESKNIVLKYEYTRHEIPNTEDSSYREFIYLELRPNDLELKLYDSNLKKVNALFGRLCFCKGQTGYYTIQKGSLSIKKIKKDTYEIIFDFSINEVPQVIKSFRKTFILKKQ